MWWLSVLRLIAKVKSNFFQVLAKKELQELKSEILNSIEWYLLSREMTCRMDSRIYLCLTMGGTLRIYIFWNFAQLLYILSFFSRCLSIFVKNFQRSVKQKKIYHKSTNYYYFNPLESSFQYKFFHLLIDSYVLDLLSSSGFFSFFSRCMF